MVTAFTVGDQATFQRNDACGNKAPYWNTVSYRLVTDGAARIAMLRTGEADIIDQVPTRDAADLKANPKITVIAHARTAVEFISGPMPRAPFRRDDQAGKPLEANPLRDPRSARVSLAINRQGIKDRVMDGYAAPTGQLMPGRSQRLRTGDPGRPVRSRTREETAGRRGIHWASG